MRSKVKIDEVDIKILYELIKDARAKLKDIAKCCGLSSTAILNRIERLKTVGVITGAALLINMSQMGYMYPVSIGVENIKPEQAQEVVKILRERANLLIQNQSAGKNNFTIFLVAKNIKDIDNLKQIIRKYAVTGKITVSLWNTPYFNFENITIQPT